MRQRLFFVPVVACVRTCGLLYSPGHLCIPLQKTATELLCIALAGGAEAASGRRAAPWAAGHSAAPAVAERRVLQGAFASSCTLASFIRQSPHPLERPSLLQIAVQTEWAGMT